MSTFTLCNYSINSYNNFPMIEVDLINEDHRQKMHISEWIDMRTNHIDRNNSYIKEINHIFPDDLNIEDLFNFLDDVIDHKYEVVDNNPIKIFINTVLYKGNKSWVYFLYFFV